MIVKNLRYSAIALAAIAFCSCQKEPSTSDLHRDYLVYTARAVRKLADYLHSIGK